MKKILFTFIIAVLTSFAGYCDNYAQATFPEKKHDFGTIKESKGSVSTTFEFVNTGNKPLIIVDATASCGCTRPEYSKKPIAPGKKGKVKVTYSTVGRPGAFQKDVKIKTNGREKRTTLLIEGTVIPDKKK